MHMYLTENLETPEDFRTGFIQFMSLIRRNFVK